MKKKTQVEQIKEMIDEAVNGTVVTNCSFVGVQYDAKAVEAITLIARGVIGNNEVLLTLAEVLKASNVEVESLLRIG
jgi:arginine/lysine/ornithine decarboxylase